MSRALFLPLYQYGADIAFSFSSFVLRFVPPRRGPFFPLLLDERGIGPYGGVVKSTS